MILSRRATKAREEQLAHAERAREWVERRLRDLVKSPAEVWLIGSLAWGEFGARSDVDLVATKLDKKVALEVEQSIARELDVEVDLLRLEDLPESFQERVRTYGIKVI